MNDRDTFAAAALTGLIANGDYSVDATPLLAYRMADAMIRERASHIPDFGKMVEIPGEIDKYRRFVGEVMNWISEATSFLHHDVLRTDDARGVIHNACMSCWNAFDSIAYPTTNHDAAPAARAEDVLKEPNGRPTGEAGGQPESTIRTGKQTAPPCVETDGFSSGSSSGQINRSPERQSPDRECGESSLRDDTHPDTKGRAWVNELQLSKVEIDALQHVVEDGRLFDLSDYGYLRSLLVRLRPEWEDESDRSKLIAEAAKTNPTQPRNGTPADGTVQDEGSVPSSRSENEPVAWLVSGCEYDTGCEYEYVTLLKEQADEAARESGAVTPLYRQPQPTLTDAEREAVEQAIDAANGMGQAEPWTMRTMRGLLERLK